MICCVSHDLLQDLNEADIIYVYDYCHYIHWLGHAHGLTGKEWEIETGPGDRLVALYKAMMKLPLWQRSQGGNFAFYDPHPGFFQGVSLHTLLALHRYAVESTQLFALGHFLAAVTCTQVTTKFPSVSRYTGQGTLAAGK